MKLFSGRINRLSYLLLAVLIYLIPYLIVYYRVKLPNLITLIAYIGLLVLEFSTLARRCHDLNKSGWWSLTLIIPLYNIYSGLMLLLGSGDFNDNRFGPPPPKGIKFF
jgi:uncharacterized membrane protein YhaH (DUF805 family)